MPLVLSLDSVSRADLKQRTTNGKVIYMRQLNEKGMHKIQHDSRTFERLLSLAQENDFMIISDEAYEGFIYDDDTPFSLASFVPLTCWILSGQSKALCALSERVQKNMTCSQGDKMMILNL